MNEPTLVDIAREHLRTNGQVTDGMDAQALMAAAYGTGPDFPERLEAVMQASIARARARIINTDMAALLAEMARTRPFKLPADRVQPPPDYLVAPADEQVTVQRARRLRFSLFDDRITDALFWLMVMLIAASAGYLGWLFGGGWPW